MKIEEKKPAVWTRFDAGTTGPGGMLSNLGKQYLVERFTIDMLLDRNVLTGAIIFPLTN